MAAELEIRNLLARVQHMVDSGTLEEYLDLFVDDAVWTSPGTPARATPPDERRGKTAIRSGVEERRAAGIQGPGTNTQHVNGTLAIEFESDDRAIGTSYFQYYTDTQTAPTLRSVGRYRHTVVRTEAGWKISRRDLFSGN
jgi:3-phenylpropionate/cinnamic acid dioxygenase small subunit